MIKNRTPLRYPGGKQKLTPFILELLAENDGLGGNYVEPYAGGAGVALELLLDDHVAHVYLNDSSLSLYSFWRAVLTQPEEFCRRIASASLTVEEWKMRRSMVQNPEGQDEFELGFSTFYLNRCNHSGVSSGGLIGGLAQEGEWKMDARFSRNALIGRIEAIAEKYDSITVTNRDAEDFITNYIPQLPENTFVYCDPPYFNQRSQLYLNSYKRGDHERIADVIQQNLTRKWIVSYDGVTEIIGYYGQRRSFLYDLQYNASRVYKGKEIFIFSDDIIVPTRSKMACIDVAIRTCSVRIPPMGVGIAPCATAI